MIAALDNASCRFYNHAHPPVLMAFCAMMPRYFQSLQIARGLCAVLVMVFHLSVMEEKYTPFSLLHPLRPLGRYAFDMFFVISGFVILHSNWDRLGTGFGGWRAYMLRRVNRIYPNYWLFCTLTLIVYAALPAMAHPHSFSPAHLLRSYALLPQAHFPLVATGWSLVLEMFFYLMFSVCFFLPRARLWAAGVAWLALLVGINALFPTTATAHQAPLHSAFAIEFLAGCAAAFTLRRCPGFAAWRLWMLLALVLVQLAAAGGAAAFLPPYYARSLWLAATGFFLFLAAAGYERTRPKLFARPALILLGDASYSLYLSHLMVFNAAVLALWWLWPHAHMAAHALWLAVILSIGIAAGCLHYLLIERRLLQAVRR